MIFRKFLPEVKRNRIFSNWVLAQNKETSGKEQLKRKFGKSSRRALIKAFLVCCAISLLIFIVNNRTWVDLSATSAEQTEQGPKVEASPSAAPTPEPCSTAEFSYRAESQKVARGSIPQIVGYRVSSSQALGGVQVVNYNCADSSGSEVFSVFWQISDDVWTVKKISRPPSGQPGDL
jgi:hypothetical protein